MSCTWFFAKVVQPPKDTPFTEAVDFVPANVVGWFELIREGKYWGWVRIEKDGSIEFGEPGV